ncbi:hypothetical protein F5Y07DRAFT_404362 [Xylaria sp. FL0933]|nr:hypothetical protein F5Y07DRAFT_404362 [Xylaria sp. FL0933]
MAFPSRSMLAAQTPFQARAMMPSKLDDGPEQRERRRLFANWPIYGLHLWYTPTGKGDKVGDKAVVNDTTRGIQYGAASGATDAGYNTFSNSFDEAILYGNGSTDWDAT